MTDHRPLIVTDHRSPTPPAQLSVIVPAYNEEALLPQTLASLQAACKSLDVPTEIIVADNDSTDDTAAIAAAAGATVVHESHRQIAANRNTGARAASGDWLLFVDADTTIPAALLQSTVNALRQGVVGGGALPVLDREVRGFAKFLLRLWRWLSRRRRWACGAYVFCRRDAFEAVGGFDEGYYCSEEIHLSKALTAWGRDHKAEFVILDEELTTSARKMEWYSSFQLLGHLLRLLVPGAMRSRRNCDLWYERPENGK